MLEVFAPASAGVETARARFIALLFRALILLDTHQFGAALADLWEAAQLRVTLTLTLTLTLTNPNPNPSPNW